MDLTNNSNSLKASIWLYLILIIFEGALRKWIFPEFANILLIIRDPIALFILLEANRKNLHFNNKYLILTVILGTLSFFSTLIFGHGNILVALFGFRIFIIHLPLIFIIGKVLNKEDVIKIGKFIITISIPMSVLIIIQFYSPQTSFINRGIGGDITGGGFSGAMGYLRPPGTFSFISGTTSFFSISACFVLYFMLNNIKINKILLILSIISVIIAIPISISRTLLFQILISTFLTFIIIAKQKKYQNQFILSVLILGISYFIVSNFNFFNTAIEVFNTRLERANNAEGGVESVLIDRYLGGLYNSISNSPNQPFLGYGLGYGSNVGSMLLTNSRTFLISEGEWGRIIGEMGPLMGLSFILIRLGICIKLIKKALELSKSNEVLPYILLTYGIFTIPQGSLSQPTSLGFIVILGGLIIASLKLKMENIQIQND
jgi:hypothetical protein